MTSPFVHSLKLHHILVILSLCLVFYLFLLLQLPYQPEISPRNRLPLQIIPWTPLPIVNGSDDNNDGTVHKRQYIKQMMLRSWSAYRRYAWGANELAPNSKAARIDTVFDGRMDNRKLGATIVDALDTLLLMGLTEEYEAGREWIARNLSFTQIDHFISVFEVNIRFLGGLLSAYALTADSMYLEKAITIADHLLPAFNSPTGLPYSWINPRTGASANYVWANTWWPWPQQHVLAEVGSLHLEFTYLSALTGNRIYAEKVNKVRQILREADKTMTGGMYGNFIHPTSGQFSQYDVSMGAFGDSFYEYLLKSWLQSNRQDNISATMYRDAVKIVVENLIHRSSTSGLVYLDELKGGVAQQQMSTLACFAAGMFALGAARGVHVDYNETRFYTKLAQDLAITCHESYIRTKTGLGPEMISFVDGLEAAASPHSPHYYILRPEVIESWFYLWRLTKEQRYRDWAWAAVQAIETYCATASAGYSGITDVNSDAPEQDNAQQSFWLAETLKYLYLIFSDDDLVPLDRWVFNTEAHLLPIQGRNPAYN